MGTELAIKENYEVAKTICSGLKSIVTSYQKDGIIRKNEIKILQENLEAARSALKMHNTTQLFVLSMDKIDDFMKRYDIDNMRESESKIFHSKLEKLNDYLDKILEDYSKGLI